MFMCVAVSLVSYLFVFFLKDIMWNKHVSADKQARFLMYADMLIDDCLWEGVTKILISDPV